MKSKLNGIEPGAKGTKLKQKNKKISSQASVQSGVNSNGGLNSNGDFYAAVEGGSVESMQRSIERQKSLNQSLDRVEKLVINSRGSLQNPIL